MQKIFYISVLFLFHSCVSISKRKSDQFYFTNETRLNEILDLYRNLNKTQPLNLGYSNRKLKYAGAEIKTDTVRYALTNAQSETIFTNAFLAFNYDTAALRQLYKKMHSLGCLWVGTEHYYFQRQELPVQFLTFRSAASRNRYFDRQYYKLIFFIAALPDAATIRQMETEGFRKIKENIYYTFTDRYR